MYEAHFGFAQPPFLNVPDPNLLFLSPQHQRALSLLEYAIESRAGFCVITGDVGAGKTTLIRKVLQDLQSHVQVGLVSNTRCESFDEFMQWILLAFDLDYRDKNKVELYESFVNFLIEQFRIGNPVTLIIDEAQHLGPGYLEQLRMLSNVNTEKGLLLQTILVGQPELRATLKRPELSQFAQRVAYDCALEPLDSLSLVEEYITDRVGRAGGVPSIFHKSTFDLIWRASGGVPRLINQICDTALLYAYADQTKTVSAAIVEQVLADKELSVGNSHDAESRSSRLMTQKLKRTGKISRGPTDRPRPKTDSELSDDSLSTIERAVLKRSREKWS